MVYQIVLYLPAAEDIWTDTNREVIGRHFVVLLETGQFIEEFHEELKSAFLKRRHLTDNLSNATHHFTVRHAFTQLSKLI